MNDSPPVASIGPARWSTSGLAGRPAVGGTDPLGRLVAGPLSAWPAA
ncbi:MULTISPECIES: hypothetical protein [Micromonospora]|nr:MULTISPECIES: hypothetical protein [Micromonospora]NES16582.1 hypothetical protein [Micromonospora sp. PPF5-17B]NES38388.1 hypothetical protein [Micromonospora solifontis]NES58361.1 hypothetical protein [Micromonospora sp. PPF5-6]